MESLFLAQDFDFANLGEAGMNEDFYFNPRLGISICVAGTEGNGR